MARPKRRRPPAQDCSRARAARGELVKVRLAGQIIRADEKDAKGRVFTAAALRQMAERNPRELVYDEDHQALLLRAFRTA